MWYIKKYNELKLIELEQILALRQSIFILEQKSYFKDIDGNDQDAIHIFNSENNKVWAYVRILIYDDIIILGRVTVDKNNRGNGQGRELVDYALKYIAQYHPNMNIQIVAMSYLKKFYQSFGFFSTSDVYIMDNDPHEDMILKK